MQRSKLLTTLAYNAAFIAMGLSMSSLDPTLPGLAEKTRAGLGTIGILFTARSLGSLAGSVWGGRLYDRLRGHLILALTWSASPRCCPAPSRPSRRTNRMAPATRT